MAQYRLRVTHPDGDSQYQYSFTALSCQGENCTAAGLMVDTTMRPSSAKIIFFRSNDGGQTWAQQDPGLPEENGQGQNEISSLQQIDSLDVIGVGDTGLCVRTHDGGRSWQKIDLNTLDDLISIHFSDSNNGIIVAKSYTNIYTTSNGCKNWDSLKIPADGHFPYGAHTYSKDYFRVFTHFYGGIMYTTRDNWKSYDSSYITGSPDSSVVITGCSFGSGDTIVAYGNQFKKGYGTKLYATRSSDGGIHWTRLALPDTTINYPHSISSIDRDTIFLVGGYWPNSILQSTNQGITWKNVFAKLPLKTAVLNLHSVAITHSGRVIVSTMDGIPRGSSGVLGILEPIVAHVESYEVLVNGSRLYPNPAQNHLTITSPEGRCRIHLMDILGSEVLRGMLDDKGTLILDVSSLLSGPYQALIEYDGKVIPVGRIAIVGK